MHQAAIRSPFKTKPLIGGNLRPFEPAALLEAAQHEPHLCELSQNQAPRSLDCWRRELEHEHALGFDLLWLSHLESALETEPEEDPLRPVLDLCHQMGTQVILAASMTPDWHERWDLDPELDHVRRSLDAMQARWGGHPAFWGWYIPHEIYMTWDKQRAYIEALYRGVSAHCKQLAPARPVTLSPFFILDSQQIFGDYRYASPQEFEAFWVQILDGCAVDIVMLQDSGEHFSYVTMEQREPFFEAMAAACDRAGKTLWGNVEVAEYVCPSIQDFERRWGRIHHSQAKGLPWRPVPIDRLTAKLELAARYSQRIVSWGYYQFGRPLLGPQAQAWYRDYQAYYQQIGAERP